MRPEIKSYFLDASQCPIEGEGRAQHSAPSLRTKDTIRFTSRNLIRVNVCILDASPPDSRSKFDGV